MPGQNWKSHTLWNLLHDDKFAESTTQCYRQIEFKRVKRQDTYTNTYWMKINDVTLKYYRIVLYFILIVNTKLVMDSLNRKWDYNVS